jgi:hypothetical protein
MDLLLPPLQLLRPPVQRLLPLRQARFHALQLHPPVPVLLLRLLADPVRLVLRLDDSFALARLDLLVRLLAEPRDLVPLGGRVGLEAPRFAEEHHPGAEGQQTHGQGKIT